MKPNKSSVYQYKYNEVLRDSNDSEFNTSFCQPPECVKEISDEIVRYLIELCRDNLTARQYEIVRLMIDGYTQQEVGIILGINQSTVSKSIIGNDYVVQGQKSKYGGATAKMRKVIKHDKYLKELRKKRSDMLFVYNELTGHNTR